MTKKRSIAPTTSQRRDYGRRLAEAIDRAGKNQAWVAEQLNCTEAQISKMCRHGSGGLWAFAQACDVIGASLDYIVLGTYPKADDWFMDKLRQLMATTVPQITAETPPYRIDDQRKLGPGNAPDLHRFRRRRDDEPSQ